MMRIYHGGNPYDVDGPSEIWSVGKKLRISARKILTVEMITADREELVWIINTCVNVPHHRTNEMQIWTGDLARFIYSCIPRDI